MVGLFGKAAKKPEAAAPTPVEAPVEETYYDSAVYSLASRGDAAGIAALGVPLPSNDQVAALADGDYPRPVFVTHAGYQAPGKDVAFATWVDDHDRIGLEALLVSLIAVYPTFASTVYVVHDNSLSSLSRHRLSGIHAGVVFVRVPKVEGRALALAAASAILTIEAPERVVVIAPDSVVLQDISPLWTGTARVRAAIHTGENPFGSRGPTGKPVIDGGVVSVPRGSRNAESVARAEEFFRGPGAGSTGAAAFDGFWRAVAPDLTVISSTFNAHPLLVGKYFPTLLSQVSLLRVTGLMPWGHLLHADDQRTGDRKRRNRGKRDFPLLYSLWSQLYVSGIARSRVRQFRDEQGESLDAIAGTLGDRPAVMIGNGPSLAETDLGLFDGFEKFAFNWFVNHEQFDEVKPDHLVLASGFFFGGWNTLAPSFPEGFLDKLTRHEHKPKLWVIYYFRDLIESTPELADYEVEYFLLEKPFNRPFDKTGTPQLDIWSPLAATNTGVLAAGIPAAVHMGARRIALVGCDSNYSSPTGSYFYASEEHTSVASTGDELANTWAAADGPGQFAYLRFTQELASRGIQLVDATVGGALVTVPKIPIERVRELLE